MTVYSSSMPSRDRQRQVDAENGLASRLSQTGKLLVHWEDLSQGCRWRGIKEESQHLEASIYISSRVCTSSCSCTQSTHIHVFCRHWVEASFVYKSEFPCLTFCGYQSTPKQHTPVKYEIQPIYINKCYILAILSCLVPFLIGRTVPGFQLRVLLMVSKHSATKVYLSPLFLFIVFVFL